MMQISHKKFCLKIQNNFQNIFLVKLEHEKKINFRKLKNKFSKKIFFPLKSNLKKLKLLGTMGLTKNF